MVIRTLGFGAVVLMAAFPALDCGEATEHKGGGGEWQPLAPLQIAAGDGSGAARRFGLRNRGPPRRKPAASDGIGRGLRLGPGRLDIRCHASSSPRSHGGGRRRRPTVRHGRLLGRLPSARRGVDLRPASGAGLVAGSTHPRAARRGRSNTAARSISSVASTPRARRRRPLSSTTRSRTCGRREATCPRGANT